jgi:basic membrane protein A
MKPLVAAALVSLAALALLACGSSEDTTGSSGGDSGASGSGSNVGLAITGPKNDKGFYQAAYEGAVTATDAGGDQLSVIDDLEQPQERFDALKNLSIENDLVIGGGAEFVDAVQALAPQYPDVKYVVLTAALTTEEPNTSAFVPRQGVPAYIAGAVAAELSSTQKVAFVGGAEIPPTDASNAAFQAGAEAQKPGTGYGTTTVGSFSDPAGAKSAAAAQIASEAGVIFAFLDAGTPGVVQAIEESGKDVKAIAAISPRCDESKAMVGTAVLNVADLTKEVIEEFEAGTLPEGKTEFFGIENPAVQRFELCPTYKTKELEALVSKLTKEINSGKITLPKGV